MSKALLPFSDQRTADSPSRTAWQNLLFLLPWLCLYELAIGWLATGWRSGADLWLRTCLNALPGEPGWLVPCLIPVGLLFQQIVQRQSWSNSAKCQSAMFMESVIAASGLLVAGSVWTFFLPGNHPLFLGSSQPVVPVAAHLAIAYLGAGLYEEILFRGGLLTFVMLLLATMRLPGQGALTIAIGLSSLVFALAHSVTPMELTDATVWADAIYQLLVNPTAWPLFLFRLFAGIYFAVLYWYRGLGVAIIAHAGYDIVVGVCLQEPL